MRLKLSRLFLILIFFSLIFLVKVTSASAATLSLSPASGSVQNGSTFSVDIKLNTAGGQIKAGSVAISYPAVKLELVQQNPPYGDYFDPSGTAYSATLGITAPTGSVGFAYLKSSAPFPSGSSLQLARLTFKALAGSGTAAITFSTFPTTSGGVSDNSAVNELGTLVSLTTSGALVTLTGTPVSPPPSPPSTVPPTTPPPAGQKTPPASSKPPASYIAPANPTAGDTTGPKISNIQVSGIGINSATISWTTNEASTSIVEYNQTDAYQQSRSLSFIEQKGELTTAHSIILPNKVLLAGYGYTFRVRSIDSSGNSTVSLENQFRTKGYTVRLKVVDKTTGVALSNVEVLFTNEKIAKTTDKDGIAVFEDIADKDQPVKVSFSGKVYLDTIVKVTSASGIGTGNSQTIQVKVAGIAQQKRTSSLVGWAMILVGVAALAGVGFVWLKNRAKVPPF